MTQIYKERATILNQKILFGEGKSEVESIL